MRVEEPRFSNCVFNVGLQCRNPKSILPSGAEQNPRGIIRFCRQVDGCDSVYLAKDLRDAEQKRKDMEENNKT